MFVKIEAQRSYINLKNFHQFSLINKNYIVFYIDTENLTKIKAVGFTKIPIFEGKNICQN